MTLDAMGATGLARVFEPAFGGLGVILTLHHVRPRPSGRTFDPNSHLEVTPEFLDDVIRLLQRRGLALLHLPEAVEWLTGGHRGRGRFAVFTIDDGYGDTVEYALPVLRADSCPFAVFLCCGIVDSSLLPWWGALEYLIAVTVRLSIPASRNDEVLDVTSPEAKSAAWQRLYGTVSSMRPQNQSEWIRDVCVRNGVNPARLPSAEGMGWEAARRLAGEPLCTLGAHTQTHPALALLDDSAALREIERSREDIAANTGVVPEYFSYPYGRRASASSREFDMVKRAGFSAAVTTRRGLIFERHADHLEALPRLFVNGRHQRLSYLDALLSGLPFAVANRMRPFQAD